MRTGDANAALCDTRRAERHGRRCWMRYVAMIWAKVQVFRMAAGDGRKPSETADWWTTGHRLRGGHRTGAAPPLTAEGVVFSGRNMFWVAATWLPMLTAATTTLGTLAMGSAETVWLCEGGDGMGSPRQESTWILPGWRLRLPRRLSPAGSLGRRSCQLVVPHCGREIRTSFFGDPQLAAATEMVTGGIAA